MDEDEFYIDAKRFWCELYPHLNIPKEIMDELVDYHFIMTQTSKVYHAVTGGRMSKVNYFAESVISTFEEVQNQETEECIKDDYEMLCRSLDIDVGFHVSEGLLPKDYDYNDLRQLIIDHHG